MIEERLGGIEQALREILAASRQQTASSTPKLHLSSQASPKRNTRPRSATKPDHVEPKGPNYRSNPAIEQHDSSSGFEGGSSLAAHSAYAREFLESAVSHGTPEMLSSPKISEALASLKHIVEMQNRRREGDTQKGSGSSHDSRLGVRGDIRDLEMPPLPIVLDFIRAAKGMIDPRLGSMTLFLSLILQKIHHRYLLAGFRSSVSTTSLRNAKKSISLPMTMRTPLLS